MSVYITEMAELSADCQDCIMEQRGLPLKARVYTPTIKKRFLSRRHPDCPLREIPPFGIGIGSGCGG